MSDKLKRSASMQASEPRSGVHTEPPAKQLKTGKGDDEKKLKERERDESFSETIDRLMTMKVDDLPEKGQNKGKPPFRGLGGGQGIGDHSSIGGNGQGTGAQQPGPGTRIVKARITWTRVTEGVIQWPDGQDPGEVHVESQQQG